MSNWWKCEILRNNTVTTPFLKGALVFAKSGAEGVTLFDGRREVLIPKMATNNIRFFSRLNQNDSELMERDHQHKKAAQVTWDPKIVLG